MLYLSPDPELEEGAGALVVETYVKQLIREGQVSSRYRSWFPGPAEFLP